MRMLRPSFLAALALLALLPASASAQEQSSRFVDSWFLGAKGGLLTFWTTQVHHAPAPIAGIETMITKRRVALYISAEQAFFKENSEFVVFNRDPERVTAKDTLIPVAFGDVAMRNMRRYSASLYAFPFERGGLRPYLGLGIAMNEVRGTHITNVRQFVDSLPTPCCATAESLESARSTTTALLTAGLQAQLSRVAVFGQATMMPRNHNSLLNERETFSIEGGIRYNIGPSREAVR